MYYTQHTVYSMQLLYIFMFYTLLYMAAPPLAISAQLSSFSHFRLSYFHC